MRRVWAFTKYWWPGLLAVVALAVAIVSIILVAPVVRAGNDARQTQLDLAPSSCKRYVANYNEGVWGRSDLERVVKYAPAPCLAAERILRTP